MLGAATACRVSRRPAPGLQPKPRDMKYCMHFALILILIVAGSVGIWTPASAAGQEWFVSLYSGCFSNTVFIENLTFQFDFDHSFVHVLSVGKKIARYGNLIGFELECQFGQHSGMQQHQEFNSVAVLRWLKFPWDDYLDTSFGFGNGLSYAVTDPPIEVEKAGDQETAQWLYYLLAEWSFELSRKPQWQAFVRIHHRSGVYGRIAGDDAVSNFVGLGLRRFF